MQEIVNTLLLLVANGGPSAIIALLLGFCIFLIWDRVRLLKEVKEKDEKIYDIVNKYYSGQMTLTEAINSLKIMMAEIKGRRDV